MKKYVKPIVKVSKKPPITVMCGGGNKCNGPKDDHAIH